MASWEHVVEALDKQHLAFKQFREANDGRIDSITDRVEEMEARASGPGRTHSEQKEGFEHLTRFNAWLRRPRDSAVKSALDTFQREAKAVTVAPDAAGGFAVPEELRREVERLELQFSPVRNLVRVLRTSTGSPKFVLNLRGATTGWVGESDTRLETATPTLREVTPTFGELYAYPQTSEWAADDSFFDVGKWLAEEVAQQFAVAEGTAVISGNGVSKPTGMLNTSPVVTDDFASPMRAAAAYEFVVSMSSEPSPRAAAVMPDALIDLVYTLNSMYRANATFVMNSNTAATIRKLKDAQGSYLWQPGLAGEPDRLLGYRVQIWEQLDDIAANAHPVAFGDFSRGYVLCEHAAGLRITVDSNITTPGRIKFFVRRREGGIPWNNDAIKWIKTPTI